VSDIEIRPLTPANLEDLFGFFEGPGFSDNPHWRGCYCLFWHVRSFDVSKGDRNRRGKAEQVRRDGGFGLLAYEGDQVAGWLNVSPNRVLPRLVPEAEVASAVCFVVRPDRRRQGLAARLLDEAAPYARSLGCAFLDGFAHPVPKGAGRKFGPEARNYHGFISMYQEAGFEEIGHVDRLVHLRKAL
jgi:GNAT superfamily N-acetyltransferase